MRNLKQTSTIRLLAALAAIGSAAITAQAQTVITGPNISGTWSPSGNPYIVAANCTVQSGQSLIIQPGTIVWMGEGTSITGNGIIQAVGGPSPASRISFQKISGGGNWNTVIINNTMGTNEFKFCDFSGATNALDFRGASKNEVMFCTLSNMVSAAITFRDNSVNLAQFCDFRDAVYGIYMTVPANNWIQTTTIQNCNFINCSSQAVYGQAYGAEGGLGSRLAWNGQINSIIKNCTFKNSGAGCRFNLWGASNYYFGQSWTGYGFGNVQILNNTFSTVTNPAIWLTVGSYAGGGPVTMLNNTIAGAGSGIVVQDPWDATIQNNIFKNCSTAVARSGSLSATLGFNDFHGNTANFSGYPVTYGQILLVNRNGTPSDVLYNIFQDPLFVSGTDLHLQVGSPCIDAGEGSAANYDSYFPPSMGGTYNDIGAYGGPGAGGWLLVAPTEPNIIPVMGIAPYVGVTINPPSPGHYRVEYASELLGVNNWLQLTNLDLTTTPFLYFDPITTPQRFYRAVKQ